MQLLAILGGELDLCQRCAAGVAVQLDLLCHGFQQERVEEAEPLCIDFLAIELDRCILLAGGVHLEVHVLFALCLYGQIADIPDISRQNQPGGNISRGDRCPAAVGFCDAVNHIHPIQIDVVICGFCAAVVFFGKAIANLQHVGVAVITSHGCRCERIRDACFCQLFLRGVRIDDAVRLQTEHAVGHIFRAIRTQISGYRRNHHMGCHRAAQGVAFRRILVVVQLQHIVNVLALHFYTVDNGVIILCRLLQNGL